MPAAFATHMPLFVGATSGGDLWSCTLAWHPRLAASATPPAAGRPRMDHFGWPSAVVCVTAGM